MDSLLFLTTNKEQEELCFLIYTYLFFTTSNVFFQLTAIKMKLNTGTVQNDNKHV